MELHRIVRIAFVAVALAIAVPSAGIADGGPASDTRDAGIVVAQAAGTTEEGRLQPRYQPEPPQEKSSYNNEYLFSLTRGVADSTLHPAAKAPMYLFTVPLDIVLLPATLIGGFFG